MSIKYAAKHGPNLKNTTEALATTQGFNAGNLWARNDTPGYFGSFGSLPEAWIKQLEADKPRYIVFSYQTPIAWLATRGGRKIMVVPDHKYSVTTSNHQGIVRRSVGEYETTTVNVTLASL